ncbi:hypothetical protein C8J57DRAFT_1334053 [Mycena rebaudengoi]|nr:hypothetical protein C8J57DRAFT_1334053 [Mycena rebaudengoi]
MRRRLRCVLGPEPPVPVRVRERCCMRHSIPRGGLGHMVRPRYLIGSILKRRELRSRAREQRGDGGVCAEAGVALREREGVQLGSDQNGEQVLDREDRGEAKRVERLELEQVCVVPMVVSGRNVGDGAVGKDERVTQEVQSLREGHGDVELQGGGALGEALERQECERVARLAELGSAQGQGQTGAARGVREPE